MIVSNALHIVPQPEKALQEIKRVLKDDGTLIAPTFTHAGNSFSGKVKAFFMKLAGFPLHSRWTSAEYLLSLIHILADHALSETDGLPPSERAAKAVLAVCRRLSDTGDMVFIENDAKLLLQRLPEGVKNVHYHDDETHIRQLLEKYDLMPR